jgi:hypothetical protein
LPNNLTVTFNGTTACSYDVCYGEIPPAFNVTLNPAVGSCFWSYENSSWLIEVDYDDIDNKFYVTLIWKNVSWPGYCGQCNAFTNITATSNSTTVSNNYTCNPSYECPSLEGGTATITW